jgi:hypothetical protein
MILFAVHGAGGANSEFLQPKTLSIEVVGNEHKYRHRNVSKIVGFYHVLARIPSMEGFGESLNTAVLELGLAERMLLTGLSQGRIWNLSFLSREIQRIYGPINRRPHNV